MMDKLLKAGADPNERGPEGETPLMLAARNGRVDAIKVLLDHKADVNAKDKLRGTTALMWAAEQGHPDAVKVADRRRRRCRGGFRLRHERWQGLSCPTRLPQRLNISLRTKWAGAARTRSREQARTGRCACCRAGRAACCRRARPKTCRHRPMPPLHSPPSAARRIRMAAVSRPLVLRGARGLHRVRRDPGRGEGRREPDHPLWLDSAC